MSGSSANRVRGLITRPPFLIALGGISLSLPLVLLLAGAPIGALGPFRGGSSGARLTVTSPSPVVSLPPIPKPSALSGSEAPVKTTSESAAPPKGSQVASASSRPVSPSNTLSATSTLFPKAIPSTSTTTTTVATSTAATPLLSKSAPSGVIGESDGHLTLNGQPYTVVGVNAYELGTDWGTNAGCGLMLSDQQLDSFFASLPPHSLIRFWAYEGTIGTNVHTGEIDWAPLDRVFAAAAAEGQLLIPVLGDQGGSCDGDQWQDPAWYDGGFMQDFNDPALGQGATPLSYWDYMRAIVQRYEDSPALGMWEPISEADPETCPVQDEPGNCGGNTICADESAAAQSLRQFFDTVGGEIHALDPNHLVEEGLVSNGQCGTEGSDWTYVSESPGLDVLSYHDYSDITDYLSGDATNGLAVRLQEAARIGKPIIGGELGTAGGVGPGCPSDIERTSELTAKIIAQIQAGSSGVLAWNWVPQLITACGYDIGPGDPLLAALPALAALKSG